MQNSEFRMQNCGKNTLCFFWIYNTIVGEGFHTLPNKFMLIYVQMRTYLILMKN